MIKTNTIVRGLASSSRQASGDDTRHKHPAPKVMRNDSLLWRCYGLGFWKKNGRSTMSTPFCSSARALTPSICHISMLATPFALLSIALSILNTRFELEAPQDSSLASCGQFCWSRMCFHSRRRKQCMIGQSQKGSHGIAQISHQETGNLEGFPLGGFGQGHGRGGAPNGGR